MTTPKSPLTRRTFLAQTGTAVAAGSALSFPAIIKARGDEPQKIGILLGKTGGFALVGDDISTGINLYLEQQGGMMNGRPTETIWLDDPDPQTGSQNATQLIQSNKVVGLIGGASSATSLAIGAVANRGKIPYVSTGNAAREITGAQCNRYTFREGWTIPAASRALAPYLMGISKKWYILVASYVFGADIMRSMTDILNANGGTIVGTAQSPSGNVDFSSYLLKIRQANPEVVMVGLPPGDLQNFFKQYVELGMAEKWPVGSLGLTQADVWAAGPEQYIPKGLYFATTWYYNNPNNTDEEKAMTKAYMAKKGKPPSEKVWEGWYSMKMLMSGFNAAGGTDPAKVVGALEKLSLPDGNHMRDWDHQMMQRFLVVKVNKQKNPADKLDDLDVLARVPDKDSDVEAMFGDKVEVACKMNDV